MSNDLILALETATRGGSLALLGDGSLIASSTGIADESHSITLLSRIESLLDDANLALRDVDLYSTAAGPGSFTGLRIGLATMKAFAATFNRPCIGVPTLEAIAFAGGPSEYTYALLPAGRGEVFAQVFSVATPGDEMPVVPVTGPEHIPPSVLLKRISEARSIHWAGPGAHLYKELIQKRATELGIKFVEEHFNEHTHDVGTTSVSAGVSNDMLWSLAPNVEQLAEYVAILALKRRSDAQGHRPEDLRAIYVRPSDAEMNK